MPLLSPSSGARVHVDVAGDYISKSNLLCRGGDELSGITSTAVSDSTTSDHQSVDSETIEK